MREDGIECVWITDGQAWASSLTNVLAERYNLDIADVYEALAYYHNNPEEMQRVEKRHDRADKEAQRRSSLTPPDE